MSVVCQTTQLATMGSYDLRYFSTIFQLGNGWKSKSSPQDCGVQCKRQDHLTLFTTSPVVFLTSQCGFCFCVTQILQLSPYLSYICEEDSERRRLYVTTFHSLSNLFFCLCHSQGYGVLPVVFLRMNSDSQEAVAN